MVKLVVKKTKPTIQATPAIAKSVPTSAPKTVVVPTSAPKPAPLPQSMPAPTLKQAGTRIASGLSMDDIRTLVADLRSGKLEYLEYGDSDNPCSMLSLFRVKYITTADGPRYLMSPIIDGKFTQPERLADDPSVVANTIAKRLSLFNEVNSKVLFAERAGIKLSLFGPAWEEE